MSALTMLQYRLKAMQPKKAGINSFAALLVVMVPMSKGAFPISLKWAQHHSDSGMGFSKFTPLLFGHVWLCLAMVLALWAKCGTGAVWELCRCRYIPVFVIGIIFGARLCCEAYAVTLIHGTVFLAIMKSSLLHCLWLQTLFLGICLDKMHVSATLVVAGCAGIYVRANWQEGGGHSFEGVVVSMIAAFLDALCVNMFDSWSKHCLKQSEDNNSEKVRCLIVYNAGRIIALIIGLFVFDSGYLDLQNSFLHGWTHHTVIGPFLINVLRAVVLPTSIMVSGALATHIFGSLDVIVAYVLERIMYESETDEVNRISMLVTLAMACVNFALYEKSVEGTIQKSVDKINAEIEHIRNNPSWRKISEACAAV